MELDQVDAVGLQPLEAAPDALEQRIGPPVFLVRPFGVTAFGEEVELLPPRRQGLADQLFALKVAFGRVDDVEAGVEGIAQQACHGVDRAFSKPISAPPKPSGLTFMSVLPNRRVSI